MTLDELAKNVKDVLLTEVLPTLDAGQKEYAGGAGDAFGNFHRLVESLGISRKQVLWVYASKHIDGIESYLRGHTSQREDVRGRIKDLTVYLMILWQMIEDELADDEDDTPLRIPMPPTLWMCCYCFSEQGPIYSLFCLECKKTRMECGLKSCTCF